MNAPTPTSEPTLDIAGERSSVWRRPDIVGGLPCVRGTRIPVRSVKSFADAGYTPEQIRREYPTLSLDDIAMATAWGRRKAPHSNRRAGGG